MQIIFHAYHWGYFFFYYIITKLLSKNMMSLFLPISLMESLSYEMHYFLHSNYNITLLKPPKCNNFSEISRNGRVSLNLLSSFYTIIQSLTQIYFWKIRNSCCNSWKQIIVSLLSEKWKNSDLSWVTSQRQRFHSKTRSNFWISRGLYKHLKPFSAK